MSDVARFLLIVPLQLLALAGLFCMGRCWLRPRGTAAAPASVIADGSGGHVVPLRAAFTGLRGLPWLALAFNNATPAWASLRRASCSECCGSGGAPSPRSSR